MQTVTRVMVRNSERSDFTDCRWKWWMSYVERWRPDEGKINALVFGDIIHRSLAGWYVPERSRKKAVRGQHPATTCNMIFDALELTERQRTMPVFDVDSSEWYDARELGVKMMEGYIEWYGLDDEFYIVYPEMPFQLDVYDPVTRKYMYTIVGTTDALVKKRSTGQMGLLEHKTAAQISTSHLALDEQANTYWTFIPMWLERHGILKPDQDLEFMEYNFLRKTFIQDDRPRNAAGQYLNAPTMATMREALEGKGIKYRKSDYPRKEDLQTLCEENDIDWQQLGEVSATQPKSLFHRETVYRNQHQRQKTLERVTEQVREMRLVRAGTLSAYKHPGKHCNWCQLKDLCEIDEYGGDTEAYLESAFHHWNPYRDHIWSLDLGNAA